MIERNHDLPSRADRSAGQQPRIGYYLPGPVNEVDLALMRCIDELHLEHPFMGPRMLRDQLHRQEVKGGRRHIGTLMLRMGIAALAPQSGTSKRGDAPEIANNDQGSQFTVEDFTSVILAAGCKLSMDGRGAWSAPTG